MMRKLEYRNGNSHGDSNNGQLLRDIEKISKALYLNKTPSTSGNARSKSAGRVRSSESRSSPNRGLVREESLYKDKRSSSSAWSWKKPLRALTHIGDKKFHCRFYLHVHSIEGLHSNFDSLSLCVHWKRKNEVAHTSLSKVSGGVAEFEETLINQCCVYGSSSSGGGGGGLENPVKYESKLFLLYPSVVEAPGLDIGKQWVDLTSFLPRTLEELRGEKSQGQWTTSFNLSGKAKGASLNVSFGFWITRGRLPNSSGNSEFPELLNMVQKRTSMDTGFGLDPGNLNRLIGSVPGAVNYGSEFLRQSLDVKVCREMLLRTGLELSNSINCLYKKLDEGSVCDSSDRSDSQELEKHKAKIDLDFVSAEEIESYDWDITEFSITEVGTEVAENEHLESDHTVDGVAIKSVDAYEIIKDNYIYFGKEMMSFRKDDDNCFNIEAEGAMVGQKGSDCNGQTLEYTDLNPNSIYKTSRSFKRSLSFDDVAESVASDFFNMLGMDGGSFPGGSDSDPESPRELLLRQFEREALASGNFLFDFDAEHKELEIYSEESELCLVIHAEDENKRVSELLKRRKAKILEDLETEALMREWGLNEKDFQNSPRSCSGGFGSPIELCPQELLPIPQLEEGFGPYLHMKNGGFLSSMNPSLFRNAKNGGNLTIQFSAPAVLPAKMGSDVTEIMQNLASAGVQNLYEQINKLVPLEDIAGKTMKQLAPNETPTASQRVHNKLESDFIASLEDLTPSMIVNKVEGLLLEGLKIQSRMSDEDQPSCITPQSTGQMSAPDLFGLSMTVDEWLRTDAGDFDKFGLLGNNPTVFRLAQLRDPLRNNEPVGVPMLLLIRLQRRVSMEDSGFRVSGVHICGVNTFRPEKKQQLWGSAAQRQSGTRWLLANSGAGNVVGGNGPKSKALIGRSSPLGVAKSRPSDILWSVSSDVCELGVYTRNPDVIFPRMNQES